MSAAVSPDEWIVLSWFYDIGWDRSSFGELRGLAKGEQAMIPRLQEIVRALLVRRLVEIVRTHDGRRNEEKLAPADAGRAVEEASSWIGYWEPGFDAEAAYYVVLPTDAAISAYEKELSDGRSWVEGVLE
jgi:hypothetical protein